MTGTVRQVAIETLRANPWNPNLMDPFMFDKAVASVAKFGFVDPVLVRTVAGGYEIIDGEHRWKAAKSLGHKTIAIWDLGEVDDPTAKQLTIVMNETRGQADPEKMQDLLKDLLSSETTSELMATLPFDKEQFEALTKMPGLDWGDLERKADRQDQQTKWVERIYRLPLDAAEVLDNAIAQAKRQEDEMTDAQALEMIAADFLGGS